MDPPTYPEATFGLGHTQCTELHARCSRPRNNRNMGTLSVKRAKRRQQRCKPALVVEIHLEDPRETYSSKDVIHGQVTVQSPADFEFEDIRIEMLGTSRTLIERWTATPACLPYTEAVVDFLRLSQPGLGSECPDDQVFHAGETYTFRFTFVVPKQLPEDECKHTVYNPYVRAMHAYSPPSLRDPGRGDAIAIRDDLSHHSASVTYGICVTIMQRDQELKVCDVVCEFHALIIIPIAVELSVSQVYRLLIDKARSNYHIRKEVVVKRGMLFRGTRL